MEGKKKENKEGDFSFLLSVTGPRRPDFSMGLHLLMRLFETRAARAQRSATINHVGMSSQPDSACGMMCIFHTKNKVTYQQQPRPSM